MLPDADYRNLMLPLAPPVRPDEIRPAVAQRMLALFRPLTGNDANVKLLLKAMATRAGDLGIQEAGDAAAKLAVLPRTELTADENIREALSLARTFAAALAAPEPSARALWACWLAAVLAHVPRTAFVGNDAYEKEASAAADALIAHARAALRDERKASPPVLEDDVLRLMNGQIDYAPTFWSEVHAAADPASGLAQLTEQAQLLDSIQKRGWGLAVPETANLRTDLVRAYGQAAAQIQSLLQEDSAEGDDPGLQLRYAAPDDMDEKSIRGCILAMRIGVPEADGNTTWQTPAWISTFEADHPDSPGTRILDDAGVAMLIDTQGATDSDGLAEQEVVYDGQPLFAAAELDNSPAGHGHELYRAVPPFMSPPPLAFGTYYEAICGTVDNAGAILEGDLRDTEYDGMPKLDPAIFDALAVDSGGNKIEAFRLLSRQPPGAPVLGTTIDHGVASETFTSEILRPHLKETQAARIAVVYSGDGYAAANGDKQSVKLRAPSVGSVFAERWLNADALLPMGHSFRWDKVKNHDADAIRELIKKAKALPREERDDGIKRTQAGITHPAVSRIGVRVSWYGTNTTPLGTTLPCSLPLQHLKSNGDWQRDEDVTLSIVQEHSDDPKLCDVTAASGVITLRIPRGHQARVELLSFIPAKYVDGGVQSRFNTNALAGKDGPYLDAGDGTYITRNPPCFWVESLPAVTSGEKPVDLLANALELVYPVSAADPAAMSVRLKNAAVPAVAIRGFSLEQKRWQWSGYPVAFPRSDDIAEWLSLYAGTEDSMPELPDGSFTSHFDAAWRLKAALMFPIPLPVKRAANHMGLVVTPIRRFASLLKDTARKNCVPAHLFATVLATPRDLSTRLQPPVWMEAIPLPHSEQLNEKRIRVPSAPGNLAVFRDPMYDTGDTAILGGIAEKLELDVPSTWEQRFEAGVNPIFHRAPQANDSAPWVTLDLPFGLTYDQVIGGRPAQTAAVMRVHGAKGKWVLAKCRVRRVVDPELVGGSERPLSANIATLDLRLVEDGWIPEDVAIYGATPVVHINFGSNYQLDLPAFTTSFPVVYLVTWHRDRWGQQAQPTWRPLVKAYRTDTSTRVWRAPPDSQGRRVGPTDFPPIGPGTIQLELSNPATVRRLDVSDYTESRWLTFVGSFGLDKPVTPSQLKVTRNGSGFRLEVADNDVAKMPRVQKAGSLCTSMLLLFAPKRDLMRGEVDKDGGELIGVYAMRNDVEDCAVRADFDVPLMEVQRDGPCKAVLIQLQRHNVEDDNKEWTMDEHKWPLMIDEMFPPQAQDGTGGEASLRLLPEFIGEFDVA